MNQESNIDIVHTLINQYKINDEFDVINAILYGCHNEYCQYINTTVDDLLTSKGIYSVFDNGSLKVIKNMNPKLKQIKVGSRIILINNKNPSKLQQVEHKNTCLTILYNDKVKNIKICKKNNLNIVYENKIKTIFCKSIKLVYYKCIEFENKLPNELLNDTFDSYLVLDLRGNSGGKLSTATNFVEKFVPNRYWLYDIDDFKGNLMPVFSSNKNTICFRKIIVIVDRYTMSSAEMVAGVLQNNKALVVGENSFGKQVIQHKITLDENSYFLMPKYRYIIKEELNNISPDIVCKIKKIELNSTRNLLKLVKSIEENSK